MDLGKELQMVSRGSSTPGTAPRTIAFASGKGGTGVTVLLLNTAVLLAQRGKRVLVLDGNLGAGNIHVLIGITPQFDLWDVLSGEKKLAEILLAGPRGIQIIPGNVGVADVVDFGENSQFLEQLRELRASYDFLLIDVGTGMNVCTIDLLLLADEAIVVTRPEPTALAGAYGLIRSVIQQAPNYPFHVLYNMVQDRPQAEQVRNSLDRVFLHFLGYRPGYAGFVVTDRHVPMSVIQQVPFALNTLQSKATICLLELVEKLAPLGTESQGVPSLWKRIIGRRQ